MTAQREVMRVLMVRLADGDLTAMTEFYELAEVPVRAKVAGILRDRGIRVDVDRLDDIVRDVLLELVRLSPGWNPHIGAAPWTWAAGKVAETTFRTLGLFTDDLPPEAELPVPGVAVVHDEDIMVSFELAAEISRSGQALARALGVVANDRDHRIWLEFIGEKAAGNRSPAVTVAELYGVSQANVRKICQRVREGLVRLAEGDPQYESLLDLPSVAA